MYHQSSLNPCHAEYGYVLHMGEIFQDCSWIQDFEADFP